MTSSGIWTFADGESMTGSRLASVAMLEKGMSRIIAKTMWENADLRDKLNRYEEVVEALRYVSKFFNTMDGEGQRARAFVDFDVGNDMLIKEICEQMGYGAVMDSVARQWYLKDDIGAFVAGPCAVFVRKAKKQWTEALSELDSRDKEE